VAALYKKIGTPLLTDLSVELRLQGAGSTDAGITRVYPNPLTDLFAGEQLVLVGRYRKAGAVKVTISGMVGDKRQTFEAEGLLVDESGDDAHGFVEKIWATRRIGEIIDELDLNGHNQELVDELVQLSMKHGIMTPYTSFLANEEVELADRDGLDRRARESLVQLGETAGQSAFQQREAKGRFKQVEQAPASSSFRRRGRLGLAGGRSADDAEPAVETVRTIGRKTFFRKQDRWQDSTVTPDQESAAVRIVQFSPEYFELAAAQGGRWSSYFTFSEAVVVNLDGKTYRVDPPTASN
jgi:Ca-activated chloride channel family protein